MQYLYDDFCKFNVFPVTASVLNDGTDLLLREPCRRVHLHDQVLVLPRRCFSVPGALWWRHLLLSYSCYEFIVFLVTVSVLNDETDLGSGVL